MQSLLKTGKDIRPEFWGWSSYTQQACLSFLFSFFSAFQVHVDDNLCFHLAELKRKNLEES